MERVEKQTAVEFLADALHGFIHPKHGKDFLPILEQAKAMEKEIIRTAYLDGMDGEYNTSEQYYNETYKNKEK